MKETKAGMGIEVNSHFQGTNPYIVRIRHQ